MADFPPNLEDGEQWLPSDIYQEIISDCFKLEALAHDNNITQECDAKIESFEHGGTRVLKEQNCHFPFNGKGEELKGVVSNFGGTGVFLPQTTLKNSKPIKGTGVFLQTFSANAPPINRKKTKRGKNQKGTEKMHIAKKESPKKKEFSQLSTEMCLPKEWTY